LVKTREIAHVFRVYSHNQSRGVGVTDNSNPDFLLDNFSVGDFKDVEDVKVFSFQRRFRPGNVPDPWQIRPIEPSSSTL
jgi:hypothetical protein